MKEFSSNYNENLEQYKAFEYYLGLGPDRSFSQVARKFNRPSATISKWASKLLWEQRVSTEEEKIKKKLSSKMREVIAENLSSHVNLINDLISDFESRFKNKEVQVRDAKELTQLLTALTKLTGNDIGAQSDPLADLSVDDLRQAIIDEEKKWSEYDRRVVENFVKFDSSRAAGVSEVEKRDYQETTRAKVRSVLSQSGGADDVPPVSRQREAPQWRKSCGKKSGGVHGGHIPLHRELSRVVSERKQAPQAGSG